MIAATTLKLLVITPEKLVIEQSAHSLQFPLEDGQIGILPSRAPMVGRLSYGELVIVDGEGKKRYFIEGGFCQVKDGVVTILTGAVSDLNDLSLQSIKTEIATISSRQAEKASEKSLKAQELRRLNTIRALLERRFGS